MNLDFGRIYFVLVAGSARPVRAGVPIAGIRDCASDEADFKLVSMLPASITNCNGNKQGNNPSSNRTLRLTLNSAGRKLACVNANRDFLPVDLENGLDCSCTAPESTQPGGSLRQAESIGQTSEPKLTRVVSRYMDGKALDKIDELLMPCKPKAGKGAVKAPVNGMGCVMPKETETTH